MVAQLILGSLAAGSIYALMALAMSIVYKASEIPNFAQGEMAMMSTYIAFVLLSVQGYPFYLALAGCLMFAFLLGVVLEFVFIRRAKEPTPLGFIIITIGFQLMLYGLAGWKWGAEQRRIDLPFSMSEPVFQWDNMTLTQYNAATLAAAFIIMGALYLLLRHTRLGLAIKAAQQNKIAARINGISTNRILAISFGISAVVGAAAGLLVAPVVTLDPAMMWDPLLKGFAAAVLGGLNSLPGVVVGAYLLGLLENFFGYYISLEFKSVVAFLVIVLVLFLKPEGLFGRPYIKKV
jgi:branched-chain amino acid transport system permease protein